MTIYLKDKLSNENTLLNSNLPDFVYFWIHVLTNLNQD